MSDASDLKEQLRALTLDVAEGLTYLRELGVEGVEGVPQSDEPSAAAGQGARPATTTPQRTHAPVNAPALVRHARVESASTPPTGAGVPTGKGATAPPTRRPIPRVPPPSQTTRAAAGTPQTSDEQTEMPKRTTPKPTAAPEPPQMETLFGEITPMDEASLPQVGETLADIQADIGECIRCPLSQSRTRVVHSEGNDRARLMFVGEAPGADEDASGRPFVGRAGQLLNKIIEAIGLKREDVFIGNVNRCRPPQNRTPTLEEAKACKGFLLREIAVVRPEVIVVLGNTAMKNLLDTKEGITKLRGQFQDYRGIKVMPTFHPAYLLRDPSKKRETWEDMKKVRDYLSKGSSR